MSNEAKKCSACQFWEMYRAEDSMPAWGFCLRYPPVPVARTDGASHISHEWPETRAAEWCGEFKLSHG